MTDEDGSLRSSNITLSPKHRKPDMNIGVQTISIPYSAAHIPRVAYICADPGVPVFGRKGCSVHVQEVIRALLRAGAQVELFATRVDGEPPAGLEDLPVHELPTIPKGTLREREHAATVANGDLYAALERAGYFDLVYERYSLWSFMGMEYARAKGVPGLLEVNAPLIEEQAEHRGLLDRERAEWIACKVFGGATALLAVSEEVADYLRRGFPDIQGRVRVVPNGVSVQRFQLGMKPALPTSPGTFTVGFVGTLKPWHGLPTLVSAFGSLYSRAANARLLIVGDGPERESLESLLSESGLAGAAHFTGAVDPACVPGLLASMDVAAAPYPDGPNFYFSPLKVYEYMAAGLPVVASCIGQLGRLIIDNENGLLCPPGDAEALAAALAKLHADPLLRARLGQAARATVLREHSWDRVAERILDFQSKK